MTETLTPETHLISKYVLFNRGWDQSLISRTELQPRGKILVGLDEFDSEETDGYSLKEVRELERRPDVAEKLKKNSKAKKEENLKAFEKQMKEREQFQRETEALIQKSLSAPKPDEQTLTLEVTDLEARNWDKDLIQQYLGNKTKYRLAEVREAEKIPNVQDKLRTNRFLKQLALDKKRERNEGLM